MAWSWSHTAEAYSAAEANLRALDHDTLAEIAAEWRASTAGEFGYTFNETRYPLALHAARKRSEHDLADEIWRQAAEFAICDSGGYNAWMCPYGCSPHCVSYDRDEIAC